MSTTELMREVVARQQLDVGPLRGTRVAAGLTQARIAAELRVHRVTFANWELGVHRPSDEHARLWRELMDAIARELEAG